MVPLSPLTFSSWNSSEGLGYAPGLGLFAPVRSFLFYSRIGKSMNDRALRISWGPQKGWDMTEVESGGGGGVIEKIWEIVPGIIIDSLV